MERAAAFRRQRVSRARLRVRETDALLDLVEECRLRGWRLVPSRLWGAVVRSVGAVDAAARDELGINRDPDRVGDALFTVQETLLSRARVGAQPALAPIIPLFPDPPGRTDAGDTAAL